MGNYFKAGLQFYSDSRQVRKSTKDLKATERQARKTERAAKSLGKSIGRAFAGIGAGLAFRAVIKNTIEQERVTAQLNATLKSTGRFTKGNSEALIAQARAFQEVTKYGDEAVLGAQNVLLTFRRIGTDEFPRATEATLDLATAMGMDLKSAALQVGKALENPAEQMTYLSRAGITFTKQQKEQVRAMQKAGDLAGAQTLVLKELETQFGGSARAARNTFGGALSAVGNALGDLLEVDGDSLPALIDSLNELERVLQSDATKRGFGNLTTGVVNLTNVGVEALSELGSLGDQLGANFANAFGELSEIDYLQQELNAIERALSGSVMSRPLKFLFTSREELERLKAEFEELIASKAYDDLGFVRPEGPDKADLDGGSTPPFQVGEKRKPGKNLIDETAFEEITRIHDASVELDGVLRDLSASVGGEYTEAAYRYQDALALIDAQEKELIKTGSLNVAEQQKIASARALAKQAYAEEIATLDKATAAKEAELTVTEQLITDLEFEISLIGLSNIEREKAVALRLASAAATDEERLAIERLIEQKAEAEKVERVVNDFRDAATSGLADFISGTKSASDAFKSFADSIIQQAARMMAEQIIASMFGASFGAAPGGSAGGLFGTIASSLFGPGRAIGGPVYPGRLHPVVERGQPELLTVGRDKYLMTGDRGGQVEPIRNTTNNRSTSITVNVPPEVRRRTASQIANEVSRTQRRAYARNR